MSSICIRFASDELTETLRKNAKMISRKLQQYRNDNSWVYHLTSDELFVKKKYTIEDFDLIKPKDEKDYDVIYEDAIILYEHLKCLPGYILSDERFWLWLMFNKFYEIALIMMPINDESTFGDHWLFNKGKRRGIFFGVLSRLYYRVALSVDYNSEDPYYYTKFAFKNQYRIRELTWRTYSSEHHIILGVLKGINEFLNENSEIEEDSTSYTRLAKNISQLGSAKLLDVMDENYIKEKTYDYLKKYYSEKL